MSNSCIRKGLIVALSLALVLSAVLLTVGYGVSYAEGKYNRDLRKTDLVFKVNEQDVGGFYSDPAFYYEDSASGYLVDFKIEYHTVDSSDKVVYTANYPDTTTGRTGVTEYVCKQNEQGVYVVTEVNPDGNSYIPVGGFVLSVGGADGFAKVGDTVLPDSALVVPQKAVESSAKRVVVDNTNTTRSSPMVVYYDYQFGAKTGTNVFGTEMTCVYDFDQNTFVVQSFRNFGEGDASGSDIPDNSFVLSAYGEGYRSLLVRGELFSAGDKVRMVGFDFIRFGGTVRGEYDFVNPTRETNPKGMETETSPFPAYRGENQTIIYKDGWSWDGANGTGTNIYGFEAAVDKDGVVVELGVNVSKIPQGGYVISGHGTGRDFIRSNVVLGATVVLDETNKRYSVSTTLNSYYENLVSSVNSVVAQAQQRMRQLYDVDTDKLQTLIDQASEALDGLKNVKEQIEAALDGGALSEQQRLGQLMTYNNYQLQVERLQNSITVCSAESKPVSARGVWHRPVETSYAMMDENISLYKQIGINLVFVEAFYNGYSMFRSDNPDFPYNTKFDFVYTDGETTYPDYLTAFVACCKKYGIEAHAWVENFYVGMLDTVPVVANHPDWLLYNDNGTIVQRNEGGAYIFLDPANKDVQDALINYYNELLTKVPDIAGLNLDYIRYPVSDDSEDAGYTMAAMEGFAQTKGVTFSAAQKADRNKAANKFKQLFDARYLTGGQEQADQNYKDWVDYRAQIVTDFVRRIKTEVKDVHKALLSTSVFASVTDSYNAKKQDWQTWLSNGWIDIATPMAYYNNSADVRQYTEKMILSAGNNCYYYTGIASSYSGLPAHNNKEQIEASYLAGANGYVIFCSTQIIGHTDVQQALLSGVNSCAGVLPHDSTDKVLAAYFNSISDRASKIYIPSGGMTQTQADLLKAEFDKILAMDADGAINIHKIQTAVKALYSAGISAYAKGYSGQRITQQLKELVTLLDTRISVELIADGNWNPETQPKPTVTDTEIVFPSPKPDPEPDPEPKPDPEPETKPTYELVTVLLISIGVLVASSATAVTLILVRRNKNKHKQDNE